MVTSNGWILDVEFRTIGTTLLADELAGTVTFPVENAFEFDPNGGTLTFDGTTPIAYDSADHDADTITILAGLAGPLTAETAVLLWDTAQAAPATSPEALVEVSSAGAGADPLWMLLATAEAETLPLGTRGGRGETVLVSRHEDTGLWMVDQVLSTKGSGLATKADLAGVNAGTVSDGVPPTASPSCTVEGGIGSLFVTWPPETNSSPLTYDVHVSLSNASAPSSVDLVASVTGFSVNVTALADGTPLVSTTGYYVTVVARDIDGSAPPAGWVAASPRAASGPDIAADYVYAGTVLANQVNAGAVTAPLVLGASMKTAIAGARVEQDAAGIRTYAPDGTQVANLGTDGSAYFAGNADVGTLTAEGQSTFLGPVEIANGTTQTLDNVFTPGANAPNTSCHWAYNPNTGAFGGQAPTWTVLNYSAAASQMYAYTTHPNSAGKLLQVWAVDNTGGAGALVASRQVPSKYTMVGAGIIGTTHWFYLLDGNGNGGWYNLTTGTFTVVDTSAAYQEWATGTSDGTNLWTVNASGTNIVVKKWDPTNLAAALSTTTIAKPSGFSACWGAYVGSGDFGAAQIGLSIETVDSHGNTNSRQMLWYGFGGTPQPNNTFNCALGGSNSGVAYDGTRFWNACFFTIARYEGGTHKLAGATATWYSAYTWRNDASSYESVMSSVPRKFTMQSRSYPVMNGMMVPAGADHLGFYLGTGTSRTSQWLQGESTGDSLTLLPSPDAPQDLVLSGTNPPATGSFPASTPGAIVSGATDGTNPLIEMNGDGSYRLAGTNLDDTAWASLGNTVRWRVKNGVVWVNVNDSTFTTPTATKTVISTSTIPAAFRPSVPATGAGYFSGQVGLIEMDTDGNLYGIQDSGGPTANVSGVLSYPLGL